MTQFGATRTASRASHGDTPPYTIVMTEEMAILWRKGLLARAMDTGEGHRVRAADYLPQAPVGKQLVLAQRGPLDDIAEDARWQPPSEHGKRVDADGDRLAAVERVGNEAVAGSSRATYEPGVDLIQTLS